ncbi:COX assembly mitochondrial protein homolog isoform X1 [Trachemys scripta elegans]|uniref:COX assembly mitochondrial protein homolog isoform X1 n=1 Tax=Trachemys scripta elegans TaxID=31138 RepID=UPI00155765C9|nr:COX assembly mitochondrial protein homolog isoform X1 [Trachemys scripta elegans]
MDYMIGIAFHVKVKRVCCLIICSLIFVRKENQYNLRTSFQSSNKAAAFTKCCQESGFLMVVKCQQENAALKECLTTYYNDPAFYEECKIEYLKQREEFRATGIPAKQRQQKLPTSM